MGSAVMDGNQGIPADEIRPDEKANKLKVDNLNIENLLLRDEDIFQTSLNSEDYLDSLAPIIKDALNKNELSGLIHKLNEIVQNKDEELSDLSLNSTQYINSCINRIDSIQVESYELNRNLQQVSQYLNRSVMELVAKKKNLIKNKELSSKIEETTVVLNLCISVLEITNRIHDLIKQHKYFSALKLIDELTNIHLPKVENFSFAIKIYDSVPLLTKMIKEDSFENLSKWLSVNVERKLHAIGEALFDNLYTLQKHWTSMKRNKDSLSCYIPHKLNSPVEVSMRDPTLNYNIFEDKALQINLSTVYDAILVYQTLNEEELLSKLYHKEWLKKYNRVIYPITTTVTTNTKTSDDANIASFANFPSLEEYLKKIAAFFVADKQINLSAKFQIRSNSNSNDLWESYSPKLKQALLKYVQTHEFDLDGIIKFKDLVGNFLQVIENNGFKILELYEILMILFQQYFAPEIMKQFRLDFNESIQSDHYMPLIIEDRKDYENVMKVCWYRNDAPFSPAKLRQLPVTFPFSEDYVHYCLGIRSLLEETIQFISEHYSHNSYEIVNIVVNEIFERVLGPETGIGISNDIKEFITKNQTNKEVVSQSYTNLEYYLFSLYEVGKLINRRLRSNLGLGVNNMDSDGSVTLKAVTYFTDLRKFAEDVIFKMVDNKIRELLDMVDYDDWLPTTVNKEASFYIKDFALYLENLFSSIFSNLPSSFKTLGLFRSYDFVAEHFLNILKDVDRYNRNAIENFDLDVSYLEDSMSKLHSTQNVSSEGDGTGGAVALESTFTELRQCINLLKLDNYDQFTKNPQFRMRTFDRIKFEDGLKLISKMEQDQDELDPNVSLNEDSMNSSVLSLDSQAQSNFSNTASAKFAKFSSKFRKRQDPENL